MASDPTEGLPRPFRPRHIIPKGRGLEVRYRGHDIPAGATVQVSAIDDNVLVNGELGSTTIQTRRCYERVVDFHVTVIPLDLSRDTAVTLLVTCVDPDTGEDLIQARMWDERPGGNGGVIVIRADYEDSPYLSQLGRVETTGYLRPPAARAHRSFVIPEGKCAEMTFRNPIIGAGEEIVVRVQGSAVEINGEREKATIHTNRLAEGWYGGNFYLVPLDPNEEAEVNLFFFHRDKETGELKALSRLMTLEESLEFSKTKVPTLIGSASEIMNPHDLANSANLHPRSDPPNFPDSPGRNLAEELAMSQPNLHARLVRTKETDERVNYRLEIYLENGEKSDVINVKEFRMDAEGNIGEQTDEDIPTITFDECADEGPFVEFLEVQSGKDEHFAYSLTGKFGQYTFKTTDAISQELADRKPYPDPNETQPMLGVQATVKDDDVAAEARAQIAQEGTPDGIEEGDVFGSSDDVPAPPDAPDLVEGAPTDPTATPVPGFDELPATVQSDVPANLAGSGIAEQVLTDDPNEVSRTVGDQRIDDPPPASDDPDKTGEFPMPDLGNVPTAEDTTAQIANPAIPPEAHRPDAQGNVASRGGAQRLGDAGQPVEPPAPRAADALAAELDKTQPMQPKGPPSTVHLAPDLQAEVDAGGHVASAGKAPPGPPFGQVPLTSDEGAVDLRPAKNDSAPEEGHADLRSAKARAADEQAEGGFFQEGAGEPMSADAFAKQATAEPAKSENGPWKMPSTAELEDMAGQHPIPKQEPGWLKRLWYGSAVNDDSDPNKTEVVDRKKGPPWLLIGGAAAAVIVLMVGGVWTLTNVVGAALSDTVAQADTSKDKTPADTTPPKPKPYDGVPSPRTTADDTSDTESTDESTESASPTPADTPDEDETEDTEEPPIVPIEETEDVEPTREERVAAFKAKLPHKVYDEHACERRDGEIDLTGEGLFVVRCSDSDGDAVFSAGVDAYTMSLTYGEWHAKRLNFLALNAE